MATLVLQFAGAALGNAIGGPFGAVAGRAIGAVVGATIDSALLGGGGARHVEGPRLTEMAGLASTEGAPVPRVYGRARIGGELIWATRFEEVVNIARSRGGGVGGKGGLGGVLGGGGATTTTYSYFANLAVGLCEGEIAFVRRVWADGRLLDLTTLSMRVHPGTETQVADPLIVAKEGAENAPAYRGLAYVVFERLPLADFGNRIPQLAFEVVRPVGALNKHVRGVNLIPGAGEFAYDTQAVFRNAGAGVSRAENVNQLTHASDIEASLDQLQALCPNLDSVTLVVSWFADDLRAGHCTLRPKVEIASKANAPHAWSVAGLMRGAAALVSIVDGKPAYGGTPSDHSVIAAIAEIRARGLKVNLHPFIMMDIAADNALADPWTGAASQPAYPWRGDITVEPAPGRVGTADGTAAAMAQIASFVGAANPTHFASGVYAGPPEWSLRRFVLHYAKLATIAGGVDAFVLSSELRSLTRVRGEGGAFVMTDALVALAADVRAMQGAQTKLTYAADWTEYGAIVPAPGELAFPLDALWASPHIDAVGIDWYPPLSDWRDGAGHSDGEIANGASDLAFLASRVASGEAYEWFYANAADRDAQIRTAITDGAYGKPWVYRAKDLVGWWSHVHVARAGGVETTTSAWTPKMKPIWLMEVGCPAVDKGGNAPNCFPDAKSASSALPFFSHGARDDLAAMRANQATLSHIETDANNPTSSVYDGRMIERAFLWAWDARPFPDFPALATVWGDADNYEHGHWLNGRLEGAALDDLARAIAADFGAHDLACKGLDAFVDGYVIDRPMSLRAALEPLAGLYGFGLRTGRLALVGGARRPVAAFGENDLVADRDGRVIELTRAQETELPAEATIAFSDAENDYRRAAASSRRLSGLSRRQLNLDAPIVARRGEMRRLADRRLQDAWTARETVRFAAPPSMLRLETGDRVTLAVDGAQRVVEIRRIVDGATRVIDARGIDDAAEEHIAGAISPRLVTPPPIAGAPHIVTLDLPIARGDPTVLQYVAAHADPWPGALTVWRKRNDAEFSAERVIPARATLGTLLDPLPPGPLARWDRAHACRVTLHGGTIGSVDDLEALAGENAFAIRKPDGAWEIVIAAEAVLVAPKTWRLARFLRGLGGSEASAAIETPAGADIVKLDATVAPLADTLDQIGADQVWRIGAERLDLADPRVIEFVARPTTLSLKPLALVHLRARRGPEGVTFSWIRRSRIDGDAWGLDDVPLGEDGERYELDILDAGGAVKRTLAASSPMALYPAAQELADFGAAQAMLDVAVAQLSATVGRGFVRRVAIVVN